MKKIVKKLVIPVIIITLSVTFLVFAKSGNYELYMSTLRFPIVLLILESIIWIIVKIDKYTRDIKCTYHRNVDDIVDPVIAEMIIDNKIDNNKMIMSILLDLKTRGNIDFIDNSKMRFLNNDNLNDYEINLIDAIFNNQNEIDLESLKTMFLDSAEQSIAFFKKIENIKITIKNRAYSSGIYNSSAKFIFYVIQCILVAAGARIFFLLFDISNLVYLYFFIIGSFISYRFSNKSMASIFFRNYKNIDRNTKMIKNFFRIVFAILLISSFIMNGLKDISLIVYLIVICILYSMCNTKIFTSYGKQEYLKVLGLKKYLEDYSLLKEKDTLDTVVWEKYIVYATAFGITDKIMDRTYENYMKANVFLQVLQQLLFI